MLVQRVLALLDLRETFQQFVERDRKLPHSDTRRIEHCVGNCRAGADDTDLAQTFDAERIRVLFALGNEDRIDLADVGVGVRYR